MRLFIEQWFDLEHLGSAANTTSDFLFTALL